MISLAEYNKCTGCMACKEACPKQCISMKEDKLGNLYPSVDSQKCIKCKICESVCPELNKKILEFNECTKVYAVWSKDKEIRKESASGGVATEFYKKALKNNYWISGVEYTDTFNVIHTVSNNIDSISKYRQSKYVYSDSNNIYSKIKQLLDDENNVLFISLPCKIAGLKAFLDKKYDNLITVDIVCHGTPSHKQLWEHIKEVDIKEEAKKLKFREDNEFKFNLKNSNGRIIYNKIGRTDTYLAAFLEGLNYRESCYNCPYAQKKRISDITICDFWGIGKEVPFNHPYTGAISAVMIHTENGNNFFNLCKDCLFYERRPIDEVISGNAQLNHPVEVHKKRILFEKKYNEDGFEKAVKVILKNEIKKERIKVFRQELRKNIRKIARIFILKYRSYK